MEFAKEQNDEELWEDLLKYAMDKPRTYKFDRYIYIHRLIIRVLFFSIHHWDAGESRLIY